MKDSYGTVSGSVAWYKTLREFLIRECDLYRSVIDESLYIKYNSEGDVCGIVNVVVDDLCMAGDKSFDEVYTKLRERFKFGKWETGHGEFCGRKLVQDSEGIHVF